MRLETLETRLVGLETRLESLKMRLESPETRLETLETSEKPCGSRYGPTCVPSSADTAISV